MKDTNNVFTVQLDTKHLELAQTAQGKGSKVKVPSTADISFKSWIPRFPTLLCLISLHISLLSFDNLLKHLTGHRETLRCLLVYCKGYYKCSR